MNWKAILKALGVAAASGAVNAVIESTTTGSASTGKTLAVSAAIGALIGAAGYLKQSPIEPKKEQ